MLIACPECNRQISDKAVACPQCGFPIEKRETSTDSPITPSITDLVVPPTAPELALPAMVSVPLQSAHPASPDQSVPTPNLHIMMDASAASGSSDGGISQVPVIPPANIGHPWLRYFARMLDYYICYLILLPVWVFFACMYPWAISGNRATDVLWLSFLSFYMEPVLEALCIWLTGYTPGKFLMAIRVLDDRGRSPSFGASFRRAFDVLVFGTFFHAPILNLLAMGNAHAYIKAQGSARWDSSSASVRHFSSHWVMGMWGLGLFIGVVSFMRDGHWLETLFARIGPVCDRIHEERLERHDPVEIGHFIDLACLDSGKELPKKTPDGVVCTSIARGGGSVIIFSYSVPDSVSVSAADYHSAYEEFKDRLAVTVAHMATTDPFVDKCRHYGILFTYHFMDSKGKDLASYTYDLATVEREHLAHLEKLKARDPVAISNYLFVECFSYRGKLPQALDATTTFIAISSEPGSIIVREHQLSEKADKSIYMSADSQKKTESTLIDTLVDNPEATVPVAQYKQYGIQVKWLYRLHDGSPAFSFVVDFNGEKFANTARLHKMWAHDPSAIASYLDELSTGTNKTLPKTIDEMTSLIHVERSSSSLLVFSYRIRRPPTMSVAELTANILSNEVNIRKEMFTTPAIAPQVALYRLSGISVKYRYVDENDHDLASFVIEFPLKPAK